MKSKSNLQIKGGFSDVRLRFFILAFMSLTLISAPLLGFFSAFIGVLVLAFFVASKISAYQRSNALSIYKHLLAMDIMYNNGKNADHYKSLIKSYKKSREKEITLSKLELSTSF